MHTDQGSLFGNIGQSHISLRKIPNLSSEEILAMEKEVLGVYVSGHPLDTMKEMFEKSQYNLGMVNEGEVRNEQTIRVGGIIETIKVINTKKGAKMAFMTVSDFTGSSEVVVFPKIFAEHSEILIEDNIIKIEAKVSDRDGQRSLLLQKIKLLKGKQEPEL